MTSILNKLATVYSSVYNMKRYSIPKIYPKKVLEQPTKAEKIELLKKRWYVYYSFVHPSEKTKSGSPKKVPQTPIFYNVNRDFKTFKERLKHIKIIRDSVEELLEHDYSPYDDNVQKSEFSADSLLDFALNIKKQSLKQKSFEDYKSRIKLFKNHLKTKGLLLGHINSIDKKVIMSFLNNVSKKSSARNRNNTKAALSSIFSVLEENDYIPYNFIKPIKSLKTKGKRDKTYSEKKLNEILNYLEKEDPLMLLFIKFVSYFFWRPIENVRLTVADINLDESLIQDETKTKGLKTKIIPTIIYNDIREYLDSYPDKKQSDYIFTPIGVGSWERDEVGRREYFTRRYRKIKKILNIDSDYSIYSFRHTYITKAFKTLKKEHGKDKAIQILSQITGHESKAIWNYIHHIDADLPEDYSDLLK